MNGAGDANAYSDSEEEGDEEGQDEDSGKATTFKMASQISGTTKSRFSSNLSKISILTVVFIVYFITIYFSMAHTDSNDSRQEDILTLELSPENDKQVTSLRFSCVPISILSALSLST